MLNHQMKLYEMPEVTDINRLPANGIVIPENRRFSLDGQWDFKLFASPENLPGTDEIRWDKINVPANWTLENTGDLPIYTNIQMPFANEPPFPPEKNPTGIYRKEFVLPENFSGRRIVLHIGGVESYFELFVNGKFAGMGKDTRLPSEFEVTGFLAPGTNEIICKVLRFSDSSYIEDQDQWWMAGIYRSVYLYDTGKVYFEDFFVNGSWDCDTGKGILECFCHIGFELNEFLPAGPGGDYTVKITLSAADGSRIMSRTEKISGRFRVNNYQAQIRVDALEVAAWSGETPVLYECRAELFDADGQLLDTQSKRCGFRQVKICGSSLLINGKRVMIKGVNRHEHDCRTGKTLSLESMMADIRLLKQFNFNAVRTCHYPDDERWYDLCDEYGIYLIDEANIESHANYPSLCRNHRWKNAFVSRVQRMIKRDRSHVSVIGWSLGNESGHGENHLASAEAARALDKSRFIFHEGESKQGWTQNNYDFAVHFPEYSEVFCGMYVSPESLQEYDLDPAATRPAILSEYAHQMGNSGSLSDYWEVFYAGKKLQGGFIWDWVDQGLEKYDAAGKLFYAYGGDFGESIHDADFCCNGLLAPDRSVHPGMYEFRHLVQDVKVSHCGGFEFEIFNRRDFTAPEHLAGSYTVEKNGRACASGQLTGLDTLLPQTGMRFVLPLKDIVRNPGEEVFINFAFTAAYDLPAIPAGTLLAHDQIDLTALIPADGSPESAVEKVNPGSFSGRDGSAGLRIGDSVLMLDPSDCRIKLFYKDELISGDFAACSIFRAPVENDGVPFRVAAQSERPLGQWLAAGFDRLTDALAGFEITENTLSLTRKISCTRGEMTFIQKFTAGNDGAFTVSQHYMIPDDFPTMPRIGVICRLENMDDIEYFGRGPWENYSDRKSSSQVGRFRFDAGESRNINYCVPQEYGNHTDTREVICRSSGIRLQFSGMPHFGFGAGKYTPGDLFAAMHPCELPERRETYLTLDLKQRGMGSSACGPLLPGKYALTDKDYRFEFRFRLKEE